MPDMHENLNTCNIAVTWTIDNFSKVSQSNFRLPTFSTQFKVPVAFYVSLQPKKDTRNREYIGIYITLLDNIDTDFFIQFTILDSEKKKIVSKSLKKNFKDVVKIWGFPMFIKRSSILERVNYILKDDKVIVMCEVSICEFDSKNNYSKSEVEAAMCRLQEFNDFEQLLCNNDMFPDVTINIDEVNYPAHKSILASRSLVFRAMFEHEMQESTSNKVVIKDIRHPVMKELLRFVYAGKVNDIDKIAFDLLAAANKYDIKGLKSLCEASLLKSLNIENAVDYLRLSDIHEASVLKDAVIVFIAKNSKEIVKIPNFKLLAELNSSLLFEVMRTAFENVL